MAKSKGKGKAEGIIEQYNLLLESQREARNKLTDSLKARRTELQAELREVERALGINLSPSRSSGGTGGSGGDGSIRWGAKNNAWIAEQVANSDGGVSMADLKAAAKKAKLSEMSVYQAARNLLEAGGLVEEEGKLKAGPKFPASAS